MKLKKILAAIAACAMSAAMLSMTVSAAGVESDDDEIVDEFDDETDDLGDDEGDDFGDDEGDDEEEDFGGDDEEEDDNQGTASEVASNPVTGNSPIALAVIPVALAAAAVVAKKAK